MTLLWRILLLSSLGSALLQAQWQQVKELRLKKDETQKVEIRYDDKKRLFTLRWTLYTNGELVVHRALDAFKAQNVLALNHTNQSLRVDISPKGTKYGRITYLFVKFKAFDEEKREALFDLLLHDDSKKIVLKYLK